MTGAPNDGAPEPPAGGDKPGPSRDGVGIGCAASLAVYGLWWAIAVYAQHPVPVVGFPLLALVAAIAITVRSRDARWRGIGTGLLIGWAGSVLFFFTCFAIVASQLDH